MMKAIIKCIMDVCSAKIVSFLFGRPGTLSAQISYFVLITAAIVVAALGKTKTQSKLTTAFSLTVPNCDGRLKHLCQNISYGKVKHPQGKHLHQQRGGGGHRQADTFRDEQARQRAEPHDHRMQPLSIVPSFRGVHTFSSWHTFATPRYCVARRPIPTLRSLRSLMRGY